jgi:hypothetical protein
MSAEREILALNDPEDMAHLNIVLVSEFKKSHKLSKLLTFFWNKKIV